MLPTLFMASLVVTSIVTPLLTSTIIPTASRDRSGRAPARARPPARLRQWRHERARTHLRMHARTPAQRRPV